MTHKKYYIYNQVEAPKEPTRRSERCRDKVPVLYKEIVVSVKRNSVIPHCVSKEKDTNGLDGQDITAHPGPPAESLQISIKCFACEECFLDKDELRIHIQSCHKNRFVCPFCEKIFGSKSMKQSHIVKCLNSEY